MEASLPKYLPAVRFAKLAGVSRPTLSAAVRRRQVRPSALCGDRPIFSLDDLERVIRELNGNEIL